MDNILLGIPSIITSVVLGYIGWREYKNERYGNCLAILLVIGLILRFYVGSDLFLHEWDERYHALAAKNLISHPFHPTLYENPILPYNYKNWGGNHIWVHKQPFPLWCMAISMKLFGINELALRLPSILISTLSIFLTYLITKEFFGVKVALIASFLHAIHGLSIELTGGRVATDHIDVFFQGLIEISILFGLYHAKTKNSLYLILMSVFCGFAILTKWLPALIVLPVWAAFWIEKQSFDLWKIFKNGILFILIVFVVAAPWQLWIKYQFPLETNWTSELNVRRIFEGIDGHGQPFYYHFIKIRIIFGELIYIPILWLLYVFFKKKKIAFTFLIIWIFVPLLFFSIVKTKMQGYLLFTAPAFFILTVLFIRYLSLIKNRTTYPKLIYLLILGLILLPVRYSIERIKPFSNRERAPQWAIELKSLNKNLSSLSKNVLFNEDRPIEAMFYCKSLTAYPSLPEKEMIQKLQKDGFTLYLKKRITDSLIYEQIPFLQIESKETK